jgi:hypothetical protein
MNNESPSESKIMMAIKKLPLGNGPPRATGLQVEHLRDWMIGTTKIKDPKFIGEWGMILKLVTMASTGEESLRHSYMWGFWCYCLSSKATVITGESRYLKSSTTNLIGHLPKPGKVT